MTNAEPPQQNAESAIEQAFQQAIAHHQADRLQEAGELYRTILQAEPNHPEANHNMGVLAVQMKQPVAGLPYFMAALDADPTRGSYWLNYIDALFQAGQLEDARQVLALARQNGLEGDEVEALALHLSGVAQVAGGTLPASPAATQNNRKDSKTKPAKPGKSAKHKEKTPSSQEIDTLVAMFNGGRLLEAAALARTMTERFPLHWVGWKMLGVVFQQMGRNADALAPMQKAAALLPNDAETHNNLGIVLQGLERLDEAEASYRRALQINPNYAQAYSNQGSAFQKMGRLDDAEASYRRALQIKPDYVKAHSNLGAVLQDLGRLDEAEASYRQALQIKPDFAEAHYNLANILYKLGRLEDALAHFQQQAKLAPGNAVTQYMIASMTGKNPERAPVEYIEEVFNSYADKFDAHLQQALQYDIPEKLAALITRHAPLAEKWNVLDLGCGTGLVGSAIAPLARQLIGVDLSAKMLEKARARNLYQRLECSDVLTMIRGEQASSYDLITSADVFIYIGEIDEIIGEIKRLLRPGGFFAFSIEALGALPGVEATQSDERKYQLQETGRYAHSVKYLARLASANGFLVQEMAATQIRTDHGKPIDGYIGLWKS